MQFLFPTFLVALATLAIPIIIHLFYFRRYRRVYFTNVRFLKEVKEETSARSKLRNLIVLIMRCLALAFLVLAFARPYIPVSDDIKLGTNYVSIFVDNSFSMNALSQDVPLLDKARQRAREIVEAYSEEDQFQILTHDLEGKHQRLLSKSNVLQYIDDIDFTPAVSPLSVVLNRQAQLLQNERDANKIIYMLSDFQRSITDLEQSIIDSTCDVNLVTFTSVQEANLSIDSCWFEAPTPLLNQSNKLLIKVRNYGKDEIENVRLTIEQDGQSKPLGSFSIPGNTFVVDTAEVTFLRGGWHQVKIAVSDYPVQFDDVYYASFEVPHEVDVLAITDGLLNSRLQAAFDGLDFLQSTVVNRSNINYSEFSSNQLIILSEVVNISSGLASELDQYIAAGGNALIFPPANASIDSYNDFFSRLGTFALSEFELRERQVNRINTEEFIFQDVFTRVSRNVLLPRTTGNFTTANPGRRASEALLTYRDGSVYLSKFKYGEGQLYFCSSPLDLDFNDLTNQAEIFIPMLYKMAISTGERKPIAYTIGADQIVEQDRSSREGGDIVYRIRGQEEFIPGVTRVGSKVILTVYDQIREAGFYDLILSGEEVAKFAFNYNRRESDMSYLSLQVLEETYGSGFQVLDQDVNASFTKIIQEQIQGRQLWRWCIALVLLFLTFEILILRFWKT
jgi:hypothetical protein